MTPVLKKLEEVSIKLDKIDTDNAKIMRGLYGEPGNAQHQLGLIDRHLALDKQVATLTKDVHDVKGFHRRIAAWGSGIILGVEGGFHAIKEFIISK